MWIALLFASLISNTGYSVTLRSAFSHKKIDPLFLAAITATAVGLPGLAGLFIADIDWSVYDLRLSILFAASIACAMIYHFVNAKALELTEASIFSIFYNFQIGFATLAGALIFGEALVPLRIAGGALVFAAGLVFAGKPVVRPAGVFFSILTALLVTALTAFDKYMIGAAGLAEYVFPSKILVGAVMFAVVFIGKRPVDKEFLKSRENAILMCFRCAAAYGIMLALSLGAFLSVSTYIISLTCVTTPIAAFLILKETGSLPRKVIAAAIALAGVTLIFIAASP